MDSTKGKLVIRIY